MAKTTFSGPVHSAAAGGELTRNPMQAAITNITDSTGGTTDGTLAAAGAVYDQAVINNNFADVAAKLNAILTALRNANIISA